MDKETPRRKTPTLSPTWQYWVRLETATDLLVRVIREKSNFTGSNTHESVFGELFYLFAIFRQS
jgi:hypothetical protein